MTRSKIIVFIDSLFYSVVCFFLIFTVENYFFPRRSAIVIAAVFSAVLLPVFIYFGIRRRGKSSLKKKEKERAEITIFSLSTLSLAKKTALSQKLASFLYENHAFERKCGGYLVKEKNVFLYFDFSPDGISKADIIKVFNVSGSEKAEIFCLFVKPEVYEFSQKFGGKIKITSGEELYLIIKDADALPKSAEKIAEGFNLKKKKFSFSLSKRNFKRLLFGGAFFLAMSAFVPLKIYYVICGSAFIFLAFLSVIFGKPLKRGENQHA